MTTQTEGERREDYAEAFREIAARIEAGDVPLPPDGRLVRVFFALKGQTPGSFAVAALALEADMEIRSCEAWATREFGAGVGLTLCAPVEDVTIERPVVTPERVFADPPATTKPQMLGNWPACSPATKRASVVYLGYLLSPGGGAPPSIVVRGPENRIVHRASSMDEAKRWVAEHAPVLELGDLGSAA